VNQTPFSYDPATGVLQSTGSIFDLPAFFITVVITVLLMRGVNESAKFNNFMVVFKVIVVLFVIFTGCAYVQDKNYTPFMPYGFFGLSFFGYTAVGQTDAAGNSVGVLAGSSIVFFAYIGFDAVTNSAEETNNPGRDLPIGIIGSLLISTLLYILVSLVIVGMVPYHDIDTDAPISTAFNDIGLHWAAVIVSLGAIAGLTSVLLVNLMGQPRILLAMARDGLLPTFLSDIHPVFKTPLNATAVTGIFVSLLASLIPLSILVEVVSMGTLSAFIFVNIGIIVLRRTQPNLVRPFVCPYVPWLPAAGAFICFMLMLSLPSTNWLRLVIWWTIGQIIYWCNKYMKPRVTEQYIEVHNVLHN
jgi:APA family basic amino acid/polyamine antiporter